MREEFDPYYDPNPIVPRNGAISADWSAKLNRAPDWIKNEVLNFIADDNRKPQKRHKGRFRNGVDRERMRHINTDLYDELRQYDSLPRDEASIYFSSDVPLWFDFDELIATDLKAFDYSNTYFQEKLVARRANKYTELARADFEVYTQIVCENVNSFLGLGTQLSESNIKKVLERIWHDEGSFDDIELSRTDDGKLIARITVSTSRVGYVSSKEADILPVIMTLLTESVIVIDDKEAMNELSAFGIEYSNDYAYKEPQTRNKISRGLIGLVSAASQRGEIEHLDMQFGCQSMVDAVEVDTAKLPYGPEESTKVTSDLMIGPYKRFANARINSDEIRRIAETEKVLPVVAKNYNEVLFKFESMLSGLARFYADWMSSQPITDSEHKEIEDNATRWRDQYGADS